MRLGADAINMVLVFGQRELDLYAYNLEIVAASIQEAHRLGMPVMLETVLWGITSTREEMAGVDVLHHVMRIAMELGARGIVFGRNVWQRPDLAAAVHALQTAVHGCEH